MKRTLNDFSQLSKAMFKAAPKVDEVKPEPPKAKSTDEAENVLAYFSRSLDPQKASKTPSAVPVTDGTASRLAALERERDDLRAQLATLEKAKRDMSETLDAARREVLRLQGECGRLQGEVRKNAERASEPERREEKEVVVNAPKTVTVVRGLLSAPQGFVEAFPGELREMVLSALSDARDAARQGARERRAAVLDAVLAENRPSGELERRRMRLKQLMKDAGYYNDPRALEELGFKFVSGRTHWKIEYAGIRMPMSKTPSDYRANINAATDMANRCF